MCQIKVVDSYLQYHTTDNIDGEAEQMDRHHFVVYVVFKNTIFKELTDLQETDRKENVGYKLDDSLKKEIADKSPRVLVCGLKSVVFVCSDCVHDSVRYRHECVYSHACEKNTILIS